MYRTSEEQIFGLLARIRERAARLMQGESAAATGAISPLSAGDEASRQALALASQAERNRHKEVRSPTSTTSGARRDP